MPDPTPIAVTLKQLPSGQVVVSAKGDIGYHEAPTLRNVIREAYDKKPKGLIVELSGVDYMATPGLATLVEALQISKKSQIPLTLAGMTERVRAVFEIARLHTVFRIVPDLDAALAP
ncbi:Anti-sigma-B factor antagonist [Phycisphaerales bacterium]|nr:Anti-sigma-B factor antagonist [Phycisphaerales bacterium]